MRWLIGGGALVLSIVFIYEAFNLGPSTGAGALLMNLGTEIVGITLTVAIVEALLEKRSRSDEARRIAWNVLHELDHAVWVWQGGGREFNVLELLSLLDQVSDDDPLPPFTQNLLMSIGSKSENTIRQRKDILKEHRWLEQAFISLSPLSNIRDSDQGIMSAQSVAQLLREGAQNLVFATEVIGAQNVAFAREAIGSSHTRIEVKPNSSVKMQEWRHYGRDFEADGR